MASTCCLSNLLNQWCLLSDIPSLGAKMCLWSCKLISVYLKGTMGEVCSSKWAYSLVFGILSEPDLGLNNFMVDVSLEHSNEIFYFRVLDTSLLID